MNGFHNICRESSAKSENSILLYFRTCMTFFLLQNTKDILKSAGNQIVSASIIWTNKHLGSLILKILYLSFYERRKKIIQVWNDICRRFQTSPTQNCLVIDYVYIFLLAQLDFCYLNCINCGNSFFNISSMRINVEPIVNKEVYPSYWPN